MAISDQVASIYIDASTPAYCILYIRRDHAKALHTKGLLQKIEGRAAYCAPRSWRQIARNITPSLSPAVLDHAWLTPREALQ